jgi:DNA-binding transcriptional MerR regulator
VDACASEPWQNNSAPRRIPSASKSGEGSPSPRRGQNRYGDYGAADAERSRLLIGLRQLDIPLEQAAELATMCAAGRCDEVSDELRALLREKRQQLARRMAEMV